MKMRTKIILGFFLTVALLIVVATLAIIIINQSSEGFVKYRGLAKDSILIGLLQAQMLEMRLSVQDFIIDGSDKAVNNYKEYLASMNKYLDQSELEITEPSRLAKIKTVRERVTIYEDTFNKVVELQHQADGYVNDSLNVIGPSMEKDLVDIMVSANTDNDAAATFKVSQVLLQLMMARLYASRFLDTNGAEYEQRVLSEMDNLNESLRELDGELQNANRRRLLEDLKTKAGNYRMSFINLAQTINLKNTDITDTLEVIGPEVAELVEEVKLSVKDEQDTIGPQLQAQNDIAIIAIVIIGLISLILSVIMALFTTSSILKQLGEDPAIIDDIARKVALGDLNINFGDNQKMIGVYKSVGNMVMALKQKSDTLTKIADGDLTVDVVKASANDELGESMMKMVLSLNELLTQVNQAIDQVSLGSTQVAQSSQALSQGAAEQASSMEEISASMNEIASQSQQNAQNSKAANDLATGAMKSAESGNSEMQELISAMQKINNSSEEIKKIVKVIDDIAFQINLLALNANVEAARAGKYGKGFAVVADEVRSLAAKSTTSVKDTTSKVEEAIRNIDIGNKAASSTATQLSEILSGASRVADLVAEISASSQEQSQGIAQVNTGLSQIDQVTQANTANAEEGASASEELASQAQQLKAMIARFKLQTYRLENFSSARGGADENEIKRLVQLEVEKMSDSSH